MPRRYCANNGPNRERRLEVLAVTVLTAIGGVVWGRKTRCGGAADNDRRRGTVERSPLHHVAPHLERHGRKYDGHGATVLTVSDTDHVPGVEAEPEPVQPPKP